MIYLKFAKVGKRAKNRPKTRKKAVERKIFILVILVCKSEKITPFCVSHGGSAAALPGGCAV